MKSNETKDTEKKSFTQRLSSKRPIKKSLSNASDDSDKRKRLEQSSSSVAQPHTVAHPRPKSQPKKETKKKEKNDTSQAKALAKKVIAMVSPIEVSLKFTMTTKLTQAVRPRVPDYLVNDCTQTLSELGDLIATWLRVLSGVDNLPDSENKFEFNKCKSIVKAATVQHASLTAVIDIAVR